MANERAKVKITTLSGLRIEGEFVEKELDNMGELCAHLTNRKSNKNPLHRRDSNFL